MKIEDQFIPIAQAKRLKELGVQGDPYFVHVENTVLAFDCRVIPMTETQSWKRSGNLTDGGVIKYYPAFTVAELGVMLPDDYQWSWPCTKQDGRTWTCAKATVGYSGATAEHEQYGATEAQARGALLIHLLESGKITADEVNNRLK